MRVARLVAVIVSALAATFCSHKSTPVTPTDPATVWADEFDGASGSLPDASKWNYDLGNNNGWGNQELETYTSSTDNVRLDGQGHLVIRVAPASGGYTSARLKTQGKFAFQYGHVEVRAKLPSGQGLWPAFWMLGTNITSVGWPACGEVDIMENVGREPSTNHGTVHGPGYSGGSGVSAAYVLPNGQKLSDDFHVFATDWTSQKIGFAMDGATYATVTPAAIHGASWVFDREFFLILNVAVGGTFPGNPTPATTFPQEMIVDYVRVSNAR